MENKKIIIANMKMNLTKDDINNYLLKIKPQDNLIICPTALYLPYFLEHKFQVGIQNISEYETGAYTGEISSKQAISMNIKIAIIGHHERRKNNFETDEIINKKIIRTIKNNMQVILCIGEDIDDYKLGRTKDVIKKQLMNALNNINKFDNIIIGYEPIWAIGTGKIPTEEEINDISNYIKEIIYNKYKVIPKVIYGGSINENNIEKLNYLTNIDGFLIGDACLNTEKFVRILETVK